MTKHNKLRYQSKGNVFPSILLSGKVHLREAEKKPVIQADYEYDYEEEEEETAETEDTFPEIPEPKPEIILQKGDIQIFLSTDNQVYNANVGDFSYIGLEGYLKANVFDGKGWKPLSLEEFFPDREHYFSKRERPLDTFLFCLPTLENSKGIEIVRTYREHYRIKTPGD